ncbi:MAG: hypothetical protein IJ359_08390 [Erysipelotrichaceae bacterium]|nr:hypothetical protein [Erysipelotrichaceae bacterium]
MEALTDLISIVPELMDLFLPGFIYMCIYNKLLNKQSDIPIMCLWSLFISYLIKVTYSIIHSHILTNFIFYEYTKVMIYVVTGALLPFGVIYLSKTKIVRKFLLHMNHQTIHFDIFDDVIDYEKKTIMKLYLKADDYYYIGTFSLKEEKGRDSYIALIDYAKIKKANDDIIFRPDYPSSILINLNDIEYIELAYSTGSKVWERLKEGNGINKNDYEI